MCNPNLLSSFRVVHTYASMTDPLGFTHLEEAYPQRRLTDLSLSSHELPVALHWGAGSCEISPIHVVTPISAVIMQVLFRQPYCWDVMGAASLFYKRCSGGGGHVYYTQCCSKHPSHLMLTGFLSPSSVVLLTCMLNHRYRDHFVTSSVLARHPGSSVVLCILTSCFCDDLHLLQKESGNYI